MPPKTPVGALSTGSLCLDLALGTGGYPRGSLIEVFGRPSSGKTTLALTAIARAQAAGQVCAVIDADHALDLAYAQTLGVDGTRLLVAHPTHAEQAFAICHILARSGGIPLIVVDSVAALVPRAEHQMPMGRPIRMLLANLMSVHLAKLAPVARRSTSTIVFTNQLRARLHSPLSTRHVTPGGSALTFRAAARVELNPLGPIVHRGRQIGTRTQMRIAKPHRAPTLGLLQAELYPGSGFCPAAQVLGLARQLGVLWVANGQYHTHVGPLGSNWQALRAALLANQRLFAQLEQTVRTAWNQAIPQVPSHPPHPSRSGNS